MSVTETLLWSSIGGMSAYIACHLVTKAYDIWQVNRRGGIEIKFYAGLDLAQRMHAIAQRVNAPSPADLFSLALAVVDVVSRAQGEGKQVLIVDPAKDPEKEQSIETLSALSSFMAAEAAAKEFERLGDKDD